MKHLFSILFVISIFFTSCNQTKQLTPQKKETIADYDLSMYPKANDSVQRYVIELPIRADEGLYNLEIWAGQTKEVDCNKHSLVGKFNKKTVKGWGYSYYEFETNGMIMSTQMACPDAKVSEKFIRSKTEHVRYNSKLPVVIYSPKNIEIEYAIWSKSDIPLKAMKK
ncbi:serine protease inhibitor ecotin [Flavicella marina]|uniref:serine protease inhibitor ecotin n=1 Tax=Flavicella marina TaxID=1475951 RepID=UPI0012644CFF|nr:serine protease inhibitor ecotin [Flavicella marina]